MQQKNLLEFIKGQNQLMSVPEISNHLKTPIPHILEEIAQLMKCGAVQEVTIEKLMHIEK